MNLLSMDLKAPAVTKEQDTESLMSTEIETQGIEILTPAITHMIPAATDTGHST